MLHPDKICVACGRVIQWRKKWERDWENVRYCSKSCRRRGVDETDATLERAILDLLNRRNPSATLCPSEAARRVGGKDQWRDLMGPARRAARRLTNEGKVVITQRGREVDPSTAKGPIRVKLNRT